MRHVVDRGVEVRVCTPCPSATHALPQRNVVRPPGTALPLQRPHLLRELRRAALRRVPHRHGVDARQRERPLRLPPDRDDPHVPAATGTIGGTSVPQRLEQRECDGAPSRTSAGRGVRFVCRSLATKGWCGKIAQARGSGPDQSCNAACTTRDDASHGAVGSGGTRTSKPSVPSSRMLVKGMPVLVMPRQPGASATSTVSAAAPTWDR